MNSYAGPPSRRPAGSARLLLVATLVAVTSAVPVATASPVAAAPVATVAAAPAAMGSVAAPEIFHDCSNYVRIGDVSARVCWNWHWSAPLGLRWRPDAFFLNSTDASKSLYVLIKTTPTNLPVEHYLGRKDGHASFAVPTSWSWDMHTGYETTTTHVARRLPGRTADCLARFRHDNTYVWLIDVTGSC